MSDRFWSKTEAQGDCLVFKSYYDKDGYGRYRMDGGRSAPKMKAHRAAWIFTHGEIPDGMFVLHKCDNPPCVKPEHLFLGTHKENMKDMTRKGRRGKHNMSRDWKKRERDEAGRWK